MTKFQLAIVVPCYNEYNRLPVAAFESFLKKTPDTFICFVNDCSTDDTLLILHGLEHLFTGQVDIVSNAKNEGKASTVRTGVLHCQQKNMANHIAYLDADLATSLEECHSYLNYLDGPISFVFASRILKIGSVVERKFSRFFFGRIIATVISSILNLKVYDTQCGCKVFKNDLSKLLFERPFVSKWLFDVELFSRMLCFFGKETAVDKMEEIPVKRWVDQGDSKVKLSYAFRLWYDLYIIWKTHKKNYIPQDKTNLS